MSFAFFTPSWNILARTRSGRRTLYGRSGGVDPRFVQNRRRDEVATRVEISGRLHKPNTSLIATAAGLVENAFFKAILPGFDAQLRRSRR